MTEQTYSWEGSYWWSSTQGRTFSTESDMNAWVAEMNRLDRLADSLFRKPEPGSRLEVLVEDHLIKSGLHPKLNWLVLKSLFTRDEHWLEKTAAWLDEDFPGYLGRHQSALNEFIRSLAENRKALAKHSVLQYRCKAKGCLVAALVAVPGGTLWVYRENVEVSEIELDEDGINTYVPRDLSDYLENIKDNFLTGTHGLSLNVAFTHDFIREGMPIANCRHASMTDDVERLLRDIKAVKGKKNVVYL